MKDQHIINMGKIVFSLCCLLGNICLFGYLFTKNGDFAIYGFILLVFATFLNLLIIIILFIYSVLYETRSEACVKAIGILMLNIPIAVIYALIGLNLN
ncbi:hypothetical protein [Chryseobacterium sp.]|uniref:hypothetical protein n=1 Tax=Chryseobacterium sp. TaxID=1871047 RepID=UPI00261C4A15|nr:hypothetical protein [Chryseobacterium sp.]